MDTTRVYRWQDYELQCAARVMDGGRYAPAVVVAKQVWPSRPREIAVPLGRYDSADTAIDAAYAQGLAWIRDYG